MAKIFVYDMRIAGGVVSRSSLASDFRSGIRRDWRLAEGCACEETLYPNGAGSAEPGMAAQNDELAERGERTRRSVSIYFADFPQKNLLFALELLGGLAGPVEFDVIGPVDDRGYWSECLRKIAALPANVTVRYRGTVPRERVLEVTGEYHFFVLPTLGENFGYAILEAMAAGCPVIISDRTPWRNTKEQGTGWSLPLEDFGLWRRVLQECVDMGPQEYEKLSLQARASVEAWATSANKRDQTIELFQSALDDDTQLCVPNALGAASARLRD